MAGGMGLSIAHESASPTPYQQWELWGGQWNCQAGEVIRYLSEATARQAGLIPGVGPDDLWLLDDERLIVLSWGADGERGPTWLVTDPERVAAAAHWWAVAVSHSGMHDYSGAAIA